MLRRPVRLPARATALSPALAPPLLRLARAEGSRGGALAGGGEAWEGRRATPSTPARCTAAAPGGHGRECGRGELGHGARVRAQGRPPGGGRVARRRRRSREEREKETWGERVARLAATSQNRCHVIAIPLWFQLEGVFCTI